MNPRIAVIATGSELMRGRSVDTHLGFVARGLERIGLEVGFHATCWDDPARLVDEIKLAAARADVVILTGGLGPTRDDFTRAAAEEAFHRPLVHRPALWRAMRARFRRFGIALPANNRRQAFIPEGATVLDNPRGSAPGFVLEADGVWFFALPGPPREMSPMFERGVLPRLARRFGRGRFRLWEGRAHGLPEAAVDEIVSRVLRRRRGISYGTQVGGGLVTVRVRAEGVPLEPPVRRLRRALGVHLLDAPTIEEAVAGLLERRQATLAVAESCTGGLIAHRLTDVPGISARLLEACVAYSNSSKAARLGVPSGLMARRGAVSPEVAAAMAEGIARTSGADIGLATTGIAGPSGGSRAKPVGLVYHAISRRGRTRVERRVFPGERSHVKERAAGFALDLLRRTLLE